MQKQNERQQIAGNQTVIQKRKKTKQSKEHKEHGQ